MESSKDANLFRTTASLYDLDERNIIKDDVNFYLNIAANLGGDILELACGTGRISIPLAAAGYKVWGVDLSKEMLDQMRLKTKDLPQTVKDRVHLVHADMSKFEIDKTFSLIIIPFRGFQVLTLEEQQGSCLDTVYRHLSDDGLFIIDVFRPYTQLDQSWIQPESFDWELADPLTGLIVRRTNIKRDIDVQQQIIYPELIYYVSDKAGLVQQLVEPLRLKYYYEDQIRNLLESHGFKIIEEMGYYDRRPISQGSELIFVCKK